VFVSIHTGPDCFTALEDFLDLFHEVHSTLNAGHGIVFLFVCIPIAVLAPVHFLETRDSVVVAGTVTFFALHGILLLFCWSSRRKCRCL
jgi:hypothetical protein